MRRDCPRRPTGRRRDHRVARTRPLAAVGVGAATGGDGRPVPVEPVGQRVRQHLLRRGRAGRFAELVGVVLRVARRPELHHGRQAARLTVGDRAVGAPVRHEQLVGDGAAGADGRCGRRSAVLRGAARVLRPQPRCGRGTAGRCGAGGHARGGVDVPLQQPRRAVGAVADGGRLLPDARGDSRIVALADARRHRHGHRVSHQDAAGLPGAARLRPCLPACRADVLGASVCFICSARWPR